MKNKLVVLRIATAFLALFALLGATGCTSPAQSTNMQLVTATGSVTARPESVYVVVDDGDYTEDAGMAQISNRALYEAIVASIEQTQLFQEVVGENAADFTLFATLVNTEQPMMGASMTAHVTIYWKLLRRSDQATLWEETIRSSSTAGAFSSFVGAKRVRLATEGAVKENIRLAFEKISALDQ